MSAADDARVAFFVEQLALAGISPERVLQAAHEHGSPFVSAAVPTLGEYIDKVADRFGDSTRRTYRTYWNLAVEMHGSTRLDVLDSDDVEAVVAEAGARARRRRPGSTGRSAEESCVAALRAVYGRAMKARVVGHNPALAVDKPGRPANRRRALTAGEVAEMWSCVSDTSSDPELDLLVVRFHLETGARRAGALGARLGDISVERQTIWLKEKFGDEREQPISASLLSALVDHANSRGSTGPTGPVLCYRPSATCSPRPVSRRRYNTLFEGVQSHLAWARQLGLCAHILRHTAGTAIERIAGHAVARAFLGHRADEGPTSIYTKASIHEVAVAVASYTGEPHPLARIEANGGF